jgi:hypothetical protein
VPGGLRRWILRRPGRQRCHPSVSSAPCAVPLAAIERNSRGSSSLPEISAKTGRAETHCAYPAPASASCTGRTGAGELPAHKRAILMPAAGNETGGPRTGHGRPASITRIGRRQITRSGTNLQRRGRAGSKYRPGDMACSLTKCTPRTSNSSALHTGCQWSPWWIGWAAVHKTVGTATPSHLFRSPVSSTTRTAPGSAKCTST